MTTVTKDILRTISYNDPTTFSGLIYDYDYDGKTLMADIAERIISDWKFDNRCKRNSELRENPIARTDNR